MSRVPVPVQVIDEVDRSVKEWNMLYCVTLLGAVFHQHAFVRWRSGLGKKDQFSQKCL